MDSNDLARRHMAEQVRQAATIQAGLSVAFRSKLDPTALDASFPTYFRSALALVSVGRDRAVKTATAYYGDAREAAGYDAALDRLPVPKLNLAQATDALLVNGPVSIKAHLADGVALAEALRIAEGKTLRAGKKLTLDAGRSHLINLSRKDKDALGWSRVSDGRPCHFCGMLVSRGPVYSENTVHFKAHNGCGCSVRPYFRGEEDGGWSPDALALKQLWKDTGGDLNDWRAAYNKAVSDPDSPVFRAITDKVAGHISAPVIVAARQAAEQAAGTAAAATAPAAVQKAPHVLAVEEAIAKLPEDRSELGITQQLITGDEARAQAIQGLAAKYGGTPAQLRTRVSNLEARRAALQRIEDYYETHEVGTKWPLALLQESRVLDVSRRQPKTILRNAEQLHYQLREELATAKLRVMGLNDELDKLLEHPPVAGTKRLHDLTPDGKLGAKTSEALDAVLTAGKALDAEVARRVAKALPGPDLAAAHDKIRAELLEVQANYRAGKFDDFLTQREREKALFLRYNETKATADAYKRKRTEAERQAVLDVLAEVREVGGGGRSKYVKGSAAMPSAVKSAMERAHTYYPTAWNDRVAAKFPEVKLGEVKRGYNSMGREIMLSRDNDSPASGPYGHVAVHELGHSMERAVPGLQAMEWALHYRRSEKITENGVTRLVPPVSIYGKNIGMGAEVHVPDRWPEKYTGKSYQALRGDLGPDSNWEIFTTGVESLLEGSRYFRHANGEIDEEFRQFILGVLSVL